jgi:hypothetical protein
MLTTFHSYSNILFSLYGTLHVAHHLLAATVYDMEWHRRIQDTYMLRGNAEKLLIWVPTGLSFISGLLLLLKNRRQVVSSWKWALFDKDGKFDWLVKHLTNVVPRSGSWAETNHRQNIIHVQYLSASLLGLCLCAHLPAVASLRFFFGGGKPINVYAAAHAMHDTNLPWIIRFIFKNYYAMLISSSASTARWLIRRKQNATSHKHDKTIDAQSTTTETIMREYCRKMFVRFIVPSIVFAIGVGYTTVLGIASKTSEELCNPHWPIK